MSRLGNAFTAFGRAVEPRISDLIALAGSLLLVRWADRTFDAGDLMAGLLLIGLGLLVARARVKRRAK